MAQGGAPRFGRGVDEVKSLIGRKKHLVKMENGGTKMLNELKKEANRTYTENGAVTYRSTMSDCLDFFSTAGALRKADEEEIISRFVKAYTEDKNTALKVLFFARDIRGGLGERRVFRTVLTYLAEHEPAVVRKNLALIAEYGRYDDLLVLMGTACEEYVVGLIREQLGKDLEILQAKKLMENGIRRESISLLAKWLPSVNTSNEAQCAMGRRIAKACGMQESEYRKALSALRREIRIIENNLREKDYTFDYEKQASRALFKYKKAFLRNDNARYTAFINAASKGEAKLNAGNIYPYELVDPYLDDWSFINGHRCLMRAVSEEEKAVLNATWSALPDFGSDENALAVVDTSGSMYGYQNPKPASVALSLGLYFAEHNRGAFANHFMTFSVRPQLIELKGETFVDRLRYAASFNEIGNTDIEAVFRLVLKTAVRNHLPQEEMPAKLVIISDMEFDCCAENATLSNFEHAKRSYEAAGYRLPQLVFWNVASRNRQQPVTMNEAGVALVSGCTPRLFSMVAGEVVDPFTLMMEVIGSKRYAPVAA